MPDNGSCHAAATRNAAVRSEAVLRLSRMLDTAARPHFRGTVTVQVSAKNGRLFGPRVIVDETISPAPGAGR